MNVNEITHKIIGLVMKVHSTLGNGFQEVIYQRALAIEMTKANLSFERLYNKKLVKPIRNPVHQNIH
jgi:GxxExxY protein